MSDKLRKKLIEQAKDFLTASDDYGFVIPKTGSPPKVVYFMADFASEQIAVAVKTERSRIADRLDEIAGEDTGLYDLDEFRDELRGEMMSDKLKPCPFCGEPGYLCQIPSAAGGNRYIWTAKCSAEEGCGVEFLGTSRKVDAIKEWNTRVDPLPK